MSTAKEKLKDGRKPKMPKVPKPKGAKRPNWNRAKACK